MTKRAPAARRTPAEPPPSLMSSMRALLGEAMDPELEAGARAMYRDDPEALELAHTLMTTGGPHARSMAHTAAFEVIDGIGDAVDWVGEDWKEDGSVLTSPRSKTYMAAAWCVGSVFDEAGSDLGSGSSHFRLLTIRRADEELRSSDDEDHSGPEHHWYWRGLAIAELCGFLGHLAKQRAQLEGFIRAAGRLPDAGAVLSTLTERRIMDIVIAREILEAQDSVPLALHDGAL